MARLVVITSLLALVQACSQRPWITEAQSGNLPNLRRYVEVATVRHEFDERRVRDLATAIAEREIATADDSEAYQRTMALGPCISELYGPLYRQSQLPFATGAAASLLLLDSDLLDSTPRLRSLRTSADGAWRAVGIRASDSAALRGEVRRALLDPDARVRHAALMTIRANPLREDGTFLFDVVRLDPEEPLRVLAVAALGESGDTRSMLMLRDLWDSMGEAVRLAFLQAIAAPPLRTVIGQEVLSRVMQSDDSMPGLVAAVLLYDGQSAESGLALGRLVHALRSGTSSEQLLALATLGLREGKLEPEIAKLARQGAPYVRIAALESLLKAGRELAGDRQRLETIASSRDADASEASRVLALRGDQQAIGRLEKQLSAQHASDRLAAARLLLRIKQWGPVALALTDDHPAVRLATACQALAASGS